MNKERFWDWISKNYDRGFDPADQSFVDTLKFIKRYLSPDDVVLDFGCATGIHSIALADSAKEVYGIDISPKMIEAANAKARANTHFSVATIFDQHEPQAFNVVLAFSVLHLLEEPQKVIGRINELLKPGGFFISSTACMGDQFSFLAVFLLLLRKLGVLPYIRMMKYSQLERLITSNFKIVETRKTSPNQYLIAARKIQ